MSFSLLILTTSMLLPSWCPAQQVAPLEAASAAMSPTASSATQEWQGTCGPNDLSSPLSLTEVVARALCQNPKIHEGRAKVQVQEARLRLNVAEYLPTLTSSYDTSWGRSASTVTDAPFYDFGSHTSDSEISVKFQWVIFDFGKRAAAVEGARQQLLASMASADEATRGVFLDAIRAYYAMAGASSTLDAKQAAERIANEVVSVATQRYSQGAAAVTDELQAQTSYNQSLLERVKAFDNLSSARAGLANVMGIEADAALSIEPTSSFDVNLTEIGSVRPMIELAEVDHPQIIAARANLWAAETAVRAAAVTDWPTVSVVGSISRSNHFPTSQFLVRESTVATDKSIGIHVDIPLTAGISRSYQLREARAQVADTEQALREAQLKVSLDVQNAYQTLLTATRNVELTAQLAHNARLSFEAIEARYRNGVGRINDVLTAQSALAGAEEQQVQSISSWRTARLSLAATTGHPEMSLFRPYSR